MSFGFKYDQLKPVANGVRAAIVRFDPRNPDHQTAYYGEMPYFFDLLDSTHGLTDSYHPLETFKEVIGAGILDLKFMIAAIDACSPIFTLAYATSARDFGVEWDRHNKPKIFADYHGEDFGVHEARGRLFRNNTKTSDNPHGIGAGTWMVGEQISQFHGNDAKGDWIYNKRNNEHFAENTAIRGVMSKYGATHGTEQDSAVIKISGLTLDMKRRFGVKVETKNFPLHANGLGVCAHNFMTHWSSMDGAQEMAVSFRLLACPSGEPVVWAKINSNGNLPDGLMLKEVLKSLFEAGIAEMESPARCWGLALSKPKDDHDISRILGVPAPVIHALVNNEDAILRAVIVDALFKMGAEHRIFGNKKMVSGLINPRQVRDQVAIFGKALPKPTEVKSIDPERDTGKPHFSVVDDINADVVRILATKQDGVKTHFAAVDRMGEEVKRIVTKKPASVFEPN